MRNLILACGVALAASIGLSAGDARADVTLSVTTPDLVYAAPGVQVVADYDDPVFYSDGFYWRYADGVWYRSTFYYGGWEYWAEPPVVITRIHRPYAYVHYRPHGYVRHFRPIAPRHDARFVVRSRPVEHTYRPIERPGVRANVNVRTNVRIQEPRRVERPIQVPHGEVHRGGPPQVPHHR